MTNKGVYGIIPGMRALRFGRKVRQTSLPKATTPDKRRVDSMYAILRRYGARLAQLEEECSTLRRDVNRVSRKQYRDEAPSIPQPPAGGVPRASASTAQLDLLFGNEVKHG